MNKTTLSIVDDFYELVTPKYHMAYPLTEKTNEITNEKTSIIANHYLKYLLNFVKAYIMFSNIVSVGIWDKHMKIYIIFLQRQSKYYDDNYVF